MGDHDALLRRYAPRLRYDGQETFFADHPAIVTVTPGATLQAADGSVLARADDGTLTLDLLGFRAGASGAGAGADGAGVPAATAAGGRTGDHPAARGERLSLSGKDYRERYAATRQEHPELRNHLVARAVRDREGALWLQYWAWYVYNDYRLAANIGLHEGDWEMVQLLLDGDDPDAARPIYAVYAQHRHAERRAWDRVERDGDSPVVHVARGSHAAYFEPGVFGTDAWIDVADGRRSSPRSTLLIVDDDTAWTRWRGRWGDTESRLDGVESDSPDSPCLHPQWTDPLVLFDQATEERLPRSAVPGPDFAVRREDGHLAVSYDLRKLDPPAVAVLVTVNSHGEPGVPPRTATFDVRDRDAKGVVTALDVADDRKYEVLLSVVTADGEPSEPVRRILDPGVHEKRKSLSTRIGLALAPLIGNLPGGGSRG